MSWDFNAGKEVREIWGFKSIRNMYLYLYASVLCPSLEWILVESNGICFIWLYFPHKLLPKHNIWQLLLKTRGLISLDFSEFWLKGQAKSVRTPSCWACGGNVALWCELRYLIALAGSCGSAQWMLSQFPHKSWASRLERALRQTCSSVLSLGHILHYLHSLSLALSRISPLHRVIGLGLQMGWQHKDCRYWDNLGESQPTPILSSLLPRSLNFLDLESEMTSAIWSFFKINLWAWSF